MPGPSGVVVGREVERAVTGLVRAIRARRLYMESNAALLRVLTDANIALSDALAVHPTITLEVRPDALIFRDEPVLQESGHEDSICFALFRDGIRRLDFVSGMTMEELHGVVHAVAFGARFSGLGDDIVSLLWRHRLSHVHYVVVDMTIVNAEPGTNGKARSPAMSNRIDAMLHAIYGNEDGQIDATSKARSLSLDSTDLEAKKLIYSLNPGNAAADLDPARLLRDRPAYAAPFRGELSHDTDADLALRVGEVVIESLTTSVSSLETSVFQEKLLAIFDAALTAQQLSLATKLITAVNRTAARSLELIQNRFEYWMAEALSEPRLRGVLMLDKNVDSEAFAERAQFIRACGPSSVPTLIPMLSSINDAEQRRRLSDLILELGVSDLQPIRLLYNSQQASSVLEAIYLLGCIATPEAAELFRAARSDPRPEARLAVLEARARVPPQETIATAAELLYDADARVCMAAANALAALRTPDSARIMESAVKSGRFDDASFELKQVLLSAYAQTNQGRALQHLSRVIKNGDGLLTKKAQEDWSVAAVLAIAQIRAQRMVEILVASCSSHNRRIRETARDTLVKLKEATAK